MKHSMLRRRKLAVGELHLSWTRVCTASFAGTERTIHFTGNVDKHLSPKAHLLYIEVP